MTSELAPHEVTIDAELAIDFIHLGNGDLQLGLRVARSAAVDLATDPDPSPQHFAYDSLVLRHLRAAESLAETAKEILLHVKRFELERRAFLDDVARLGRMNESDPT